MESMQVSEPLTIVGWLWRQEGYHNAYTVDNVNIWAAMLERNLTIPHRFVLFTDQPKAKYSDLLEVRPLWTDYHLLSNLVWPAHFPQCYVRLKAFSREFAKIVGPRYASIDLDCIVTGNLDQILGRDEDFVIYRHPVLRSFDKLQPYNGSMWLMRTGSQAHVWESFAGEKSLAELAEDPALSHFLQTDQGWISYKMGLGAPGWTMDDGVLMWSYLAHKRLPLPENAKIVFFNGRIKPWDLLWLREYR